MVGDVARAAAEAMDDPTNVEVQPAGNRTRRQREEYLLKRRRNIVAPDLNHRSIQGLSGVQGTYEESEEMTEPAASTSTARPNQLSSFPLSSSSSSSSSGSTLKDEPRRRLINPSSDEMISSDPSQPQRTKENV
ncbi:hypothetical protein PPACK8108_LOCUS17141 [Phakopsora pachyrhizi]|uniref:Uncharacterized protein n=1 Tax=Phakopsora pachyrhizi TaxID=170000 RepID=A0AAV0B8V9_PHAPC|nr:hypothetical protein PPACK8108_LOCUS17141 [Phakopsora pachyrhizi]